MRGRKGQRSPGTLIPGLKEKELDPIAERLFNTSGAYLLTFLPPASKKPFLHLGTGSFEEPHLSSLVQIHGLQVSVHPGLPNAFPARALLLRQDTKHPALLSAAAGQELLSLFHSLPSSPAMLTQPQPHSNSFKHRHSCNQSQLFLRAPRARTGDAVQEATGKEGSENTNPARAQPIICQQHSSNMETQRRPFTSLQPTLGCCFGSFPNVTPKQHCDLIARYETNPKSLLELQLSKGQAELKQHTGETTEHCWAPWPRGHIQTLVTGSGAGLRLCFKG